jgi:hypothetical protein
MITQPPSITNTRSARSPSVKRDAAAFAAQRTCQPLVGVCAGTNALIAYDESGVWMKPGCAYAGSG